MATLETMPLIGKSAEYNIDGMTIEVVIMDVRKVYNRIDYKITPAKGFGSKWVDSRKVRL